MNDGIKEQISAFVDGELADNESELLLRQLGNNAELRTEAARYLSVGNCLRGDLSMPAFRQRVAEAIAGEPTVQVEQPATLAVSNRWMRPVVGVGVAASVAVMALVGLRQIGTGSEIPPGVVDALNAVAIDAGSLSTEPPVEEFTSDRPSDMLTQYYLSHGQSSANLGSRLVGLEVREDRLVPAAAASSDAAPADGEQRPDVTEADAEAEGREQSGSAQ